MRIDAHKVIAVERPTEHGGDTRAETRHPLEVETDRHDGDRMTLRRADQCHPGCPGPKRVQPSSVVADPLGKQTDRLAVPEGGFNRAEHLNIASGVDTGIHAAIDLDRTRAANEKTQRVSTKQC